MKKNLIALSLLLFAGSALVKAQDNKITYKFGGFIEFKSYFDDYRSRVSRYDHIYFYPLAHYLGSNYLLVTCLFVLPYNLIYM